MAIMRKSIKLPLPGVPTMLVAGQILRNRYEIVKVLGSGGFAETYLANDLDIPVTPKPKCVVKRLHPQTIEPNIQRLFQKEAEILYKLAQNHDRIPKLFAYFEENQEFYLIQEFIEGHDLSKELSPGKKLSETYAIKLLQDVLEILAYVHQNNIIHRDIKPQNIMRRKDGKLMLIDFGAVKEIGIQKTILSGKTSRTVSIGTLGFMPSEQAMGKPKPSSDIYALGRTVIFALTGIEPELLEEDNDGEVIWKNHASVSDALADILSKMVRDHFTGRYANATEALQALNSFVSGSALPTAPPQTKTIISPPVRPTPSVPSQASTVIAVPVPPTPSVPSQKSRVIAAPAHPTPSVPSQPSTVISATALTTSPFQFTTVTVNARGQIVSRQQGQADVFAEKLGNNVILEMVSIPGGKFLMGSPNKEDQRDSDESPQHWVTVQPFFLGKYPVTQAQWQAVMGNNPATFKGNNRPVEKVSWDDAVEFCQKLSKKTGRNYRLPSEAEWEYACRAGTTTPFYFGETIKPDLANYNGEYTYASAPKGVYLQKTTEIGSFPPNAFGLYDMHGNVVEWCQDIWHENYNGATSDGSAWESGGDSNRRLQRGGSWFNNPRYCRSANRSGIEPDDRSIWVGFRVVLDPAAIAAPVLPTPSVPSQQTTVIAAPILPTPSVPSQQTTVSAAPVLPTPSVPSPPSKAIAASVLPTSPFQFTTFTVNARGHIVSSQQGQAEVFAEKLGNNVILEMVSIPGGKFLMGSPDTEQERDSNESPQHWVTIQRFFLGKYPVTQAQWQAVMGNNPATFKGNNRPVEKVSWDDAVEFCQKLSKKTGRNYRLPSEAEWEYACRADTTTSFSFGETITPELANYNGNYTYASAPKGVYRQQTSDVGSFSPNAFGLYDMHGNVWEWCQDIWHENYNGATSDGSAWESGGDSNCRMRRGGSWNNYPRNCRSTLRNRNEPDNRYYGIGFRVVLDPAAISAPVLPTPSVSSPPSKAISAPVLPAPSVSSPPSQAISAPVLLTPSVPSPPSQAISAPVLPTSSFQFTTVTVNAQGQIVSSQQGQAKAFAEKLGNNVSLEMVSIKGGTFLMGSPDTEKERYSSESPQHWVTLQPFFLGKYPVTQAQWQAVMGYNRAKFKGNNRPVENVSWNNAVEFCLKLWQKTGRKYRLPSEAEWEYACRAGTTTPFYFGETITPDLVNYHGYHTYASGPKGQCRQQTTDVGSFPPNAFGLYDMHGNVYEWCQDVWHENYNRSPSDGSAWESGGKSYLRLLRGGSWYDFPRNCCSAFRFRAEPVRRYDFIGFRVALVPARTVYPFLSV